MVLRGDFAPQPGRYEPTRGRWYTPAAPGEQVTGRSNRRDHS